MDAAARLALMAKAANVFSSDDTFLSFPVTPLSYRKGQLNLLDDPTFANIIEFSMITNMIPTGIAWEPGAEIFLWNVYESILREATFASSTRTDEEEAQHKEARDFLSTKGSDGTIRDSLQLMLYNHYQSQYENALQAYTSQLGTAQTFTDPTAIKTWNEITEPELRNKLGNAQTQWETQGYRDQVDKAKSVVEALGAKSPHLTWAEWSKSFNPDIDSVTRAIDQSAVFPTSYTPASALDNSSWQPFEISEAELTQLLSGAPQEIRERFDVGNTISSIESIQFEFSSAKLLRPWFRPEVFRAQFWRFEDGRLLSDGGDPPSGICPSYPVAVIFARNVVIKAKQAPTEVKPNGRFEGFRILPHERIFLQRMKVQKLRLDAGARFNVASKIKIISNAKTLPGKKIDHALIAKMQERVSPGGAVHRVSPITSAVNVQLVIHGSPRVDGPLRRTVLRPSTTVPPGMIRRASVGLLKQALDSAEVRERIQALRPHLPHEIPQTSAGDDSIHILAFVCKPVPRCPNPDADLQW
ncbi:MAG: hypothetical protein ACYC7J_06740 [Syntrophales bacterium]